MAIKDESTLRVVIYEGEGATPLDPAARFAALSTLLERGYSVTRTVPGGQVVPQEKGALVVLGQFDEGRAPVADDASSAVSVRFHHIGDRDAAGLAALVETERAGTGSATQGAWKPWFPVIDYDRCTNCMQCLSFCLFGVYGVDRESHIEVQNNDNCKTNCPACSRVCPEAAIMFPKYKAGPINGDSVSAKDLQREKMKIDISALLGGDVYSMLRERSEKARSRFSKERDSDKALAERQKCLVKLASAGDIPPEVLLSLPSPEEIARRAEEAKAKASAALAALK
jgi:Pyruvate/2-oxoacid:ferredoxin oxidoreductase delta subunit